MNVVELRNDLLKAYQEFRDKKLTPAELKEATNAVGKIISSSNVQIVYNKTMGRKDKIEFLEC